jgi:glycosyltransferase involved in cell wall biosynthesis
MARIYFDVTDVLDYARRHRTVTGIPRVQLNIIRLLARKHGGEIVRCVFFDRAGRGMREFDLGDEAASADFDAERLLLGLGLVRASRVFPSAVNIKSYLRRYDDNKLLRTWKKLDVQLSALLWRPRLRHLGLAPSARSAPGTIKRVASLTELPADAAYVCLGSTWQYPELWQFARAHRARGGDVVQMVHDLIPARHPAGFSPISAEVFCAWLDRALDDASRFVCISKWTEAELHAYAGERGKRVVTGAVPLAHEFIGAERGIGGVTLGTNAPAALTALEGSEYVLCVGTVDQRKNSMALLTVWERLHARYAGALPLLVFAGRLGTGGTELRSRLAHSALLQRYVRIAHSPSDGDLIWLYRHSLFTVYPSLAEGWGLPVGESAWFGKYCVASSASSVPEVCGDLIDYADPTDLDALTAAIERPLADRAFLRQREQRLVSAPLRRWVDVADELYAWLRGGG